jgi:hypothetical protein
MHCYLQEYLINQYIYIYIYIYIYTHIYTYTHTYTHARAYLAGVETVYEVPLLPNSTVAETFLPNGEQCGVVTG